MTLHPVYATTASFPDQSLQAATRRLQHPPTTPLLGRLSTRQVQLCPQNHGCLSPATVATLRAHLPQTQFRLHANVRVADQPRIGQSASRLTRESLAYYTAVGRVSDRLHAPAYTLHAGLRAEASRTQMVRHLRLIQSVFPCPVGVEPLYPTADRAFLLDTWDDLAWLLDKGLPYALDVSHLQIVAAQSGRYDEPLTMALLTSPACLELHLSTNDGRYDLHHPLARPAPWWWPLLQEARRRPTLAPLFCEARLVPSLASRWRQAPFRP